MIRLISDAPNVSAETLLAQAGLLHKNTEAGGHSEVRGPDVESAIKADSRLTSDQQSALIAVFRSMLPVE